MNCNSINHTLEAKKLGNKRQLQAGPSRTGNEEGAMGTSQYRTIEDCKAKTLSHALVSNSATLGLPWEK